MDPLPIFPPCRSDDGAPTTRDRKRCNLHEDQPVMVNRGERAMGEVASRELEPVFEREHLVQFRRGGAREGEAAFEALFRLHQRSVRGWILRIVRDPGAADELT